MTTRKALLLPDTGVSDKTFVVNGLVQGLVDKGAEVIDLTQESLVNTVSDEVWSVPSLRRWVSEWEDV